MRHFRELARGLGFALLTAITVIGGLALAFTETGRRFPTATPIAQLSPTETLFVPSPIVPTFATADHQLPATSDQLPTSCPPPFGWLPVTVTDSDTLVSLAAESGLSAQFIVQANCLPSDSVFAGQIIYLPAFPATLPPVSETCGPPAGWHYYTVQPGDNLFRLSLRYGTTIAALQRANCLTGITIAAGRNILVPPVTPIPNTPTVQPSFTATQTLAPSATLTPTFTPSPAATSTVTATFTSTDLPTQTATATVTSEASATASATNTDTETASPTFTPTASETPTITATVP